MTLYNQDLANFAKLVETNKIEKFKLPLRVGVDLGTANIVLAVVDADNKPIAGMSQTSTAVKDGIVVDYVSTVQKVKAMKAELEKRLGVVLEKAGVAVPPGILPGNIRCIANCVEGADLQVVNIVDEPTAAAQLLGITQGAVVDVGGGTTGISILQDGKVVFTGDEPTGGNHMTLTLAGYFNITKEEAEKIKVDPVREQDIFPIVKPVVEKMATIIKKFLQGHQVEQVYVVGGACSFAGFTKVFENILNIATVKPNDCLLVTPLGIALAAIEEDNHGK